MPGMKKSGGSRMSKTAQKQGAKSGSGKKSMSADKRGSKSSSKSKQMPASAYKSRIRSMVQKFKKDHPDEYKKFMRSMT